MLKMSSQHSFTVDTVLPVSGSEIDTRDCPNWNSTMSVQLSIHDCFQCYERMNSCTPTATQVKTKIMKQSKAAPWISVYIVELIFMNVIVYVIGVARTENNHCFSSLFVHYYYHIHGALHYAEATNLCSNLSLSLSFSPMFPFFLSFSLHQLWNIFHFVEYFIKLQQFDAYLHLTHLFMLRSVMRPTKWEEKSQHKQARNFIPGKWLRK